MAEARIYLDTSALLPYYRPEPVSGAVEDFLRCLEHPVTISRLTDVELASALNRLLRMGELEDPDVLLVEHAYFDDLREGRFELVPVAPLAFSRARRWLSQRQVELRTLDALHLAACAELGTTMVTCDKALQGAAVSLGVDSKLVA